MRVAVTGTPGTGKTTAVGAVETDLEVVHLNEVIRERGLSVGIDETRDSLIADLDAVREWFDGRDDVLVESHLAHHLPVDRVVVLRCAPAVLEDRLRERSTGGESSAGADESPLSAVESTSPSDEPSSSLDESSVENATSEALDLVLAEAVEMHGENAIYEIDTTDREPPEVAREIERVIAGTREPSVGTVSFIDYL